jgi:hypothetical protein
MVYLPYADNSMNWTTLRLDRASFKSQLNSNLAPLGRSHGAGHRTLREGLHLQLQGHYHNYVLRPKNITEVNDVPTSQGRSALISETGHKEAQDA